MSLTVSFPRAARALFTILVCASALTGCRSFNAYCTEVIDCQDGNDADIEACETAAETDAENASVYGCSSEFDALTDCVEAESSCEGDGDYRYYSDGDNCNDERIEYNECVSA